MNNKIKKLCVQNYLINNKHQGFTLIELLVVIIIVGILAAIALPSFLNCRSIPKSIEAKAMLEKIIESQQKYYNENGKFTNNFNDLRGEIKLETSHYRYQINLQSDPKQSIMIVAHDKN